MPKAEFDRLRYIARFDQLLEYLRDHLDWPIERADIEDATFDYEPDELGLDAKSAVNIRSIKQLRPFNKRQPWGVFFVEFENKRLPVVVLRRILRALVLKKRQSANTASRAGWQMHDLLFVLAFGEHDNRSLTLAHFSDESEHGDLPVLRVLAWDERDTVAHIMNVAATLQEKLRWPRDENDMAGWRNRWSGAFSEGYREIINTSKDLARRLAALATRIRSRANAVLAVESETGPLKQLHTAFKSTLIHDLSEDDFADMYAQTIAYGLLSARISRPAGLVADNIADMVPVTNPFLKDLLQTFLSVSGRSKHQKTRIDFDELGINEVVQTLRDANMEAVLRDFDDKNPLEDPVIHFYELFLKEYDAEKRMQRGVFYTPRPVVSYIVRSVDQLLRTEFGLEDGLADTTTWSDMAKRHKDLAIPEGVPHDQAFVEILDPATGTGTFLVEVIDIIHKTLVGKWKSQNHGEAKIDVLWNAYVPMHLLPRLHGYELLMAPYAIAHLKIGLKLYETGYRFGSNERARIYMTNTLEPAHDFAGTFEFAIPALAHEARAVNEIKRKQRFTVVIGNPPYSAVSSNLTPELRRIVDPYRSVNGERIRERSMLQFEKNIQDDYVKFFAFSQAILDKSSRGICSLITNHSYLDGPTLRGLRWNLISGFQSGWFLDLHGNANKAEVAPDSVRDENVFDIRQGVAICALVKNPSQRPRLRIQIGGLWGERGAKYERLSVLSLRQANWTQIEATPPYYYLVGPDVEGHSTEWGEWPAVCDLFTKRSTGTETGFDDLFVNFTKVELKGRLALFADPSASRHSLADEFDFSDGHAAAIFDRRKELRVIRDEEYGRFQLRAYDYRWVLLRKNMLKTNSFNVMLDLHEKAPGLVTTRQTKENFSAFAVNTFCGHKVTSGYDRSYVLPLFTQGDGELLSQEDPCLDRSVLAKFRLTAARDAVDPKAERQLSLDIFRYTIAILNAPSYTQQFSQRLKRDWPKVPLPNSKKIFEALAQLGGQLVALQLMESPLLDRFVTTYSGPQNPEVVRVGWSNETVWLDAAATKKDQPATPGTIGFRGVPKSVWNFHIGGYQVCEKWLKDRKGRTLSKGDIAHYQKIVVALNETIRLLKEIDEVIAKHGGWPGAFSFSKKAQP